MWVASAINEDCFGKGQKERHRRPVGRIGGVNGDWESKECIRENQNMHTWSEINFIEVQVQTRGPVSENFSDIHRAQLKMKTRRGGW